MTLRDQLLTVADAYATARKIGRKRVSAIVLNRGSKLDQIASFGADINTGTFERAMVWFSENWPVGAVWPEDVSRPEVMPCAA